jgi:hypothetical protein
LHIREFWGPFIDWKAGIDYVVVQYTWPFYVEEKNLDKNSAEFESLLISKAEYKKHVLDKSSKPFYELIFRTKHGTEVYKRVDTSE